MIITLQTLMFFRETLIAAIDRLLRPYFTKLSLHFKGNDKSDSEEHDCDDCDGCAVDDIFAEFDDDLGVIFYPRVFSQRYSAVIDCFMDERWKGKLEKVVDFGYHDLSFIAFLKDVADVKYILGVDVGAVSAHYASRLLKWENYGEKRDSPLRITLFQGNAADPDYRLIGCDAVIAIELIEHMLPHDLERFVHTVFGFIKPCIAVFTTPNAEMNVLFKTLEENGLRRPDHYFEWTREQFNDWCSNIVSRYPQYTVVSKGVGPGPPGTWHLGCCSQLALFVAKHYHKQVDLDLNSLARIPRLPSPKNLSVIADDWQSPRSPSDSLLNELDNDIDESYTKLSIDQQSFMTIVITSPTFSVENLAYQDKILQCNLEYELGKNFLMFDDEVYFNVLIPRRKQTHRVYEIEDVASRLYCSTMQVRSISKTTQDLMAKNDPDNLANTRKIVDDMRHLIKSLNLNPKKSNEMFKGDHIWCNINWGENAPYWNQYYNIVKEYIYPYEVSSCESHILDAVTQEINRHIAWENEIAPSDTHIIPVSQLMDCVKHITVDEDKVRNLLEWNGYDTRKDVVICTRPGAQYMASNMKEKDSQETLSSDWDTSDVHSKTMFDSTSVPDYYGRCLRRALDQKVNKLRSLLTADEDFTRELDRIVCRLMELALYKSKLHLAPPPANWMQLKLLDLLTLTEKAIERRRRYNFENYPVKAIEYCNENNIERNMIDSFRAQDNIVKDIVSKYHDVVKSSDFNVNEDFQNDQRTDFEFENTTISSVTSKDIEEFINSDNSIPVVTEGTVNNKLMCSRESMNEINTMKLSEVDTGRGSMDSNIFEPVSYPQCEDNNDFNNCNESIDNVLNNDEYVNKVFTNSHDVSDTDNEIINSTLSVSKANETVPRPMYDTEQKNGCKTKSSKIKTLKKVASKIANGQHKIKRRKIKEHQKLQSTLSKPIPDSLIKLCDLGERGSVKNLEAFCQNLLLKNNNNINPLINIDRNIAATEDTLFLGIVTEDGEESIALRRNIGIDPAIEFEVIDNEDLETVINVTKVEDFLCEKNVDGIDDISQTIFIYDINEPSTSKGVRNLSMDAQCGPDVSLTRATISATTSLTVMPNIFSNCIKIEDSHKLVSTKTSEFGTCTESMDRPISTGIKIKDSEIDISNEVKCSKMIDLSTEIPCISNYLYECTKSETKLLKPAPSALRTEDSGSEHCSIIFSLPKSPSRFAFPPKNSSNIQIQSISKENIVTEISQINCVKQKLICGGVHIHSFKERLFSEDVVYQGEWQRIRSLYRKNPQDAVIKRSSTLQKKKKPNCIENMNTVNEFKTLTINQSKKMSIKPTFKTVKSNEFNKKTTNKYNTTKNNIKIKNAVKINKTAVKTTSVVTMSSLEPKKIKSFHYKNITINLNPTPKNKDGFKNYKNKNYIPAYLRKRIQRSSADFNSKAKFEPRVTDFDKDKTALFYSLKEGITKELLKFEENIKVKNNYIVCRNEDEVKSGSSKRPLSSPERVINNNINLNRNHSPPSQNSSTCSSPNSVATVRAAFTRNTTTPCRRSYISSIKNSSGLDADNNKSLKNKNHSKRYKSTQKSPNKSLAICSNKENMPESSKNVISCKKEMPKASNCAFVGKTKSVFIAQATGNSALQLTPGTVLKKDVKKLMTKHDNPKNNQARCLSNASIPNIVFKPNYNLEGRRGCNEDEGSNTNINILQTTKYDQVLNTKDSSDSSESPNKSIHSTQSSIMSAIRQLIEQKIHINGTDSHDSIVSGSETIILNRDNIHNSSFHSSSSPLSISTVIATEDNISDTDTTSVPSPLVDHSKTDQNDSLLSCSNVKPPTKEIDALSSKSSDPSSVSTSKFSEYYLADNELDNTVLNMSSLQDIFERNDRVITNIDGLLAAQAFSGFSINTGSFVGDRLDNVNLIDSETGSTTLDSARQALSEELFVSGRSSDTYESCLIEEDVYVPNWLFNAISQQPSIEESEAEDEFPMPIPLGEPVFDVNGNAIEPGVGVGAGAGDGRGMHSDQSQDSSGRGTSLSSSATSSGQSEAILIDLSAIAANQPHYVHEPMNIPVVDDEIDEAHRSSEGNNMNVERTMSTNCLQLTSDIDADISSLDTDAIDSDD